MGEGRESLTNEKINNKISLSWFFTFLIVILIIFSLFSPNFLSNEESENIVPEYGEVIIYEFIKNSSYSDSNKSGIVRFVFNGYFDNYYSYNNLSLGKVLIINETRIIPQGFSGISINEYYDHFINISTRLTPALFEISTIKTDLWIPTPNKRDKIQVGKYNYTADNTIEFSYKNYTFSCWELSKTVIEDESSNRTIKYDFYYLYEIHTGLLIHKQVNYSILDGNNKRLLFDSEQYSLIETNIHFDIFPIWGSDMSIIGFSILLLCYIILFFIFQYFWKSIIVLISSMFSFILLILLETNSSDYLDKSYLFFRAIPISIAGIAIASFISFLLFVLIKKLWKKYKMSSWSAEHIFASSLIIIPALYYYFIQSDGEGLISEIFQLFIGSAVLIFLCSIIFIYVIIIYKTAKAIFVLISEINKKSDRFQDNIEFIIYSLTEAILIILILNIANSLSNWNILLFSLLGIITYKILIDFNKNKFYVANLLTESIFYEKISKTKTYDFFKNNNEISSSFKLFLISFFLFFNVISLIFGYGEQFELFPFLNYLFIGGLILGLFIMFNLNLYFKQN